MANDLNNVTIIGRLTKDPDFRSTVNGTSVATFSIAVTRKFKETENVSFFNCVAWASGGEIISKYYKKGDRIAIDGHLQQRSWEDKNGNKRYEVEIIVKNCQHLSYKKQEPVETVDAHGFMEDQPAF